jgi:hypothetical protein
LYANLQVKTRRQEKSGTSDVKKATRQNTILYGNLQEKCRYQKKAAQATQKKAAQANASPFKIKISQDLSFSRHSFLSWSLSL